MLKAINEKILSMDYSEYGTQIKTVDAQESLSGGVIVLVTGYLTGRDDLKREFTQTFFLATQDKGYYVLNDIFRFVEESDQPQEEQSLANETDALHIAEPDSIPSEEEHVPERTAAEQEEDELNEEELYNPSEHEEGSAVDDEEPVDEVINEVPTVSQAAVAETGPSTGQEQKKSYASIVRVMKENNAPVLLATSAPGRPAQTNTERHTFAANAPAPPASDIAVAASNTAESCIVQELEADGFSIYIKSLPLNATPAQLEEEFKKFGPIKPNGIQVRSNKSGSKPLHTNPLHTLLNGTGYAGKASPIVIGGRQAHVEEKRTTGSRGKTLIIMSGWLLA
ncbi:Nuclear transport factor 2 [Apostasia shenzhenica]|uniref:Nuclear transport factor 2 n=1 Tax=Apostasia shenzhenica TaxID=1088818 RepID=A0A2I0B0E0_9ASPA|nr:Nuclear transport factor 2 [Apostasia shenzhenica]